MKKSKFLAVLLIFCLAFVIISPAVYAAHDDGKDMSDKGQKGRFADSRGKGGSHKDHSTVTNPTEDGDEHEHEDGEEEGGSGKGADKKGAIGKGGQGKGGVNGGAKKGMSRKDIGGTITLEITVEWPKDAVHPDEVDVTLFREGEPNTVETVNGVAIIYSEASGDCTLVGEAVPGFTIPEMNLQLTGNSKVVKQTLEYHVANNPVTGINLNKTKLELIKGYTEEEDRELIATVKPENANNQGVTWSSSDEDVATVNNGIVEGQGSGTATITVTTNDNNKAAQCEVTVATIDSLEPLAPIQAVKGQLVVLPKTVVGNLSLPVNDSKTKALEVAWELDGKEVGSTYQVSLPPEDIPIHGDYTITLEGYVNGYETSVTLNIEVDMAGIAVPVTDVSLNKSLAAIELGSTLQLVATVVPEDATTKDVIWSSSNKKVATVDQNGLVTPVATGMAVITVETVDGEHTAYCQVSVGVVPETVYIFPTLADAKTIDHFEDEKDVYINVENLITKLENEFEEAQKDYPATGVKYYVKVEDSSKLLGSGEVIIYGDGKTYIDLGGNPLTEENCTDTNEFNLYAATQFAETDNYSNRYFVSMSQDERYPKDDEKTLSTNFSIGGTTPTIPTDNVKVQLDMIGGSKSPEGVIFLLCREISGSEDGDRDGIVTWKDYYPEGIPSDPYLEPGNGGVDINKFSDEVKMIGLANADGVVVWNQPRETLKLGGYYLLEVTPKGYTDNLYLPYPESDDGELFMEVHLTRDGSIERNVINTYIGR